MKLISSYEDKHVCFNIVNECVVQPHDHDDN